MSAEEPQQLLKSGKLTEINGIGPATASVIKELIAAGSSTLHRTVQGTYPSSLVELEAVPGLTYKQIRKLYDQAGIRSVRKSTRSWLTKLC